MLDTTFAALMWTILRKGWISWGMVALRFLDGKKKQSNVYTFALTLHSSELFCWALYPRLAVLVCLHLIPNGLLLAAPQCGSWV